MIGVNLSEALVELEAIAGANEALKGKRRLRDAAREPPGIHPPRVRVRCLQIVRQPRQTSVNQLQRWAAMEDTEVLLQSHEDNHNILPVPLFKSAPRLCQQPPTPHAPSLYFI